MNVQEPVTTSPRAAPHAPGDVLAAKYRLEQLAGEGAMGEVWLATHLALEMPVALKLIRKSGRARREGLPTLARGVEAQLLREAQAIARLTHPNIVRVHDFGLSEAGDPFIVMERLEGEDLRDRLQRTGRIPVVEAVGLALLVIHAMHTAHARGVVHRDLKPENIFLTMDDEGRVVPKVLDFGIADLEWETNSKPTLAGTPAYMAPEQLSLGIADHRVDVWAISVVLYEMISGRTPVAASVVSHVPTRVGSAREDVFDPPTLLGRFDVDDELWAILGRGLRSAATRYTSMREIGEALARWLIERGVTEGLDGVSLASKWPEEGPRCERPAAPAAGWVGRTSASFTPGQLVSPTDNGRAITFVRSRARERRRFASVIVGATLALGASGWAIHASVDPTSVESRGAVFSATRTSAAPMEVDSTPVSPPEAPPATSVRAPIVRAAASTPPATRGARAPSAKPYALPPRASSAAPSAAPTTIASSAPSTAPEDIPYLDALVTDRPVTDPLGRPRGF